MRNKYLDQNIFTKLILGGSYHLRKVISNKNIPLYKSGEAICNAFRTAILNLKETRKVKHIGKCSTLISETLNKLLYGKNFTGISQFFSGFSMAVKEKEVLDAKTFLKGWENGMETSFETPRGEENLSSMLLRSYNRSEDMLKKEDDLLNIWTILYENSKPVMQQKSDDEAKCFYYFMEGINNYSQTPKVPSLEGDNILLPSDLEKELDYQKAIYYFNENPEMWLENIKNPNSSAFNEHLIDTYKSILKFTN